MINHRQKLTYDNRLPCVLVLGYQDTLAPQHPSPSIRPSLMPANRLIMGLEPGSHIYRHGRTSWTGQLLTANGKWPGAHEWLGLAPWPSCWVVLLSRICMALHRSLAFCFQARAFFFSIGRLLAATWRQTMYKSLQNMCALK